MAIVVSASIVDSRDTLHVIVRVLEAPAAMDSVVMEAVVVG